MRRREDKAEVVRGSRRRQRRRKRKGPDERSKKQETVEERKNRRRKQRKEGGRGKGTGGRETDKEGGVEEERPYLCSLVFPLVYLSTFTSSARVPLSPQLSVISTVMLQCSVCPSAR